MTSQTTNTPGHEILPLMEELAQIHTANDNSLMTIGEVSQMLGLTPRCIRFYEEAGIVTPRRSGRFRLFSYRDLRALELARRLRFIGLEVKDIARLVQALRGEKARGNLADLLQDTLSARLEALESELRIAQQKLAGCKAALRDLDTPHKSQSPAA